MKRVLVTGGTRGIGLAIVKAFSERGDLVTATYSSDESDRLYAETLCPNVQFLKVDSAKEEELIALFAQLSSLDVLVLNAGVSSFAQIQDISQAEYRRVMDVNFGGALFACKHALKKLFVRGGSIVAVTSVWGERGASCESLYAASKAAVAALIRSLAKELAPAGVTCNCVSPGVVDTRMNAKFSEEELETLKGEIPLGRFARPEEIAAAAVFLSEQPYITGQVLTVDGGFTL